jgi:hypothetical protein
MSDEGSQQVGEQFASLVTACDDALAAVAAWVDVNHEVSAVLRVRLECRVACMKLLRRVLTAPSPNQTRPRRVRLRVR